MTTMVKIIYKEDFNLTVEGHAGTAVIGQDILCSAVSILIYTLAQSVLENSLCMEKPPIVSLESGKAVIKCRPKQKYKRKIKDIFNTIMTGFDLLANSYEKNIKIF